MYINFGVIGIKSRLIKHLEKNKKEKIQRLKKIVRFGVLEYLLDFRPAFRYFSNINI